MADFITVTLLRHGVTKANLEKRYLGWTDMSLLPAEMERLKTAQRFWEKQFDLCVTSDLLRARQTVELLCPKLEPIETKAFREMNFGAWEMKTYADLKNDAAYRAWIEAPETITPPGGEHFQEMKQRIEGGLRQLRQETAARGSRNILLVAHGGVIRYLLTLLTGDKKQFFEWNVSHDTGIRLIWETNDWREGRKCISLQEVPLTARGNG